MSDKNKAIVENANALLAQGKSEEFLSLCSEDVEWTLLAETPSKMKGREAIRAFMASTSKEGSQPPKFTVDRLIAEGFARLGEAFLNQTFWASRFGDFQGSQ